MITYNPKSIPMSTPHPVIKDIYNLVSSVQVKSIDAYLTLSVSLRTFPIEQYANKLQDSLTFLTKILLSCSIFGFVIRCACAQWEKKLSLSAHKRIFHARKCIFRESAANYAV